MFTTHSAVLDLTQPEIETVAGFLNTFSKSNVVL
jgi:hypothetical protein